MCVAVFVRQVTVAPGVAHWSVQFGRERSEARTGWPRIRCQPINSSLPVDCPDWTSTERRTTQPAKRNYERHARNPAGV